MKVFKRFFLQRKIDRCEAKLCDVKVALRLAEMMGVPNPCLEIQRVVQEKEKMSLLKRLAEL